MRNFKLRADQDHTEMDAAFGDQGHSGHNNMNSLNGTLSEENGSFGNNLALEPKARKPYTITKQRERWTDEEHRRFLDALRLHGRAWRRIEEHIGTKTTVQIRSHAQKFFSKVARGANGNVEIPPPRPKRKPNHPYPRKQSHPYQKEIWALKQLKDSLSLQASSISEEENRSPTSVLSLLRSENAGAFFSNKPNRNRPPAASAAGSNEQDDRIQSQTVSDEEDNKHTSLGLKSDGKRTEFESTANQASGPRFEDSKKTVLTLKLFGRTVTVTESGKQANSNADSASGAVERSCEGFLKLDAGSSAQVIQDGLQGGLLPMFYCAPPYEYAANSAAEAGMIPVPQWAFYSNLPSSVADEQYRFGYREDSAESNVQNECSGTGSNTVPERGNVCDSQNGDQCSEKVVKPVVRYSSVFRNQKVATDSKSEKGFMPYRKRLVKEKA